MTRDHGNIESPSARARLRRELADERIRSGNLQRQAAAIEASTSWRITAPLRWLVSVLRGGAVARRGALDRMSVPDGVPHELFGPVRDGLAAIDLHPFAAGLLDETCIESFSSAAACPPAGAWSQPRRGGSRIAFIGGADLARELSHEAAVLCVESTTSPAVIATERPDFVLVEANLAALEPAWAARITDATGDGMAPLLAACRAEGIPIVAWLRAEPRHVERMWAFIDRVDRLYAADDSLLAMVATRLGAQRASLLPPAVQPAFHNPVRTPRLTDVASRMAGMVLVDGLEQCTVSCGGRPAAQRPPRVLAVESGRHTRTRERRASLPGAATVVDVDGLDKLLLQKMVGAEYFDSPGEHPSWWVAQEMLRAAACGAVVGASPGVAGLWPLAGTLPLAGDSPAALSAFRVDNRSASAWSHSAFRAIAAQHSLSCRLERIRADLGLPGRRPGARVSALLVSRRPDRLLECLASFARQTYDDRELILVVHGAAAEDSLREAAASVPWRVEVLEAPGTWSLGECLNLAASESSGDYWVKLDDDDRYGEHYVSDLMALATNVPCDVFGKPMVYTFFEADGVLVRDPVRQGLALLLFEPDWPRGVVCGATLGGRIDVLRSVPFPVNLRKGTDTAFLEACAHNGLRLLSGDGFSYVCHRHPAPGFHTWEGAEAEVRARGIVVGDRDCIRTEVGA